MTSAVLVNLMSFYYDTAAGARYKHWADVKKRTTKSPNSFNEASHFLTLAHRAAVGYPFQGISLALTLSHMMLIYIKL